MSTLADGQGWHLDKRVPIALILALAIQVMAGVWAAATLSATIAVQVAHR
jgi:hypothetical protein